MGGRCPWSGRGLARSGPASDARWARPATTRPQRPGEPDGQDVLGRADILERVPGRWSSSRLGAPPRWLLAVIAVLVLAGGVTAFAAGGLPHGQAPARRSSTQVAVLPTACTYLIGPTGRTALADGRHEPRQDNGCARPGPGQAGIAGNRSGASAICVALNVQAWHPASQFGIRHRCYPGLT